MKELEEKRKGIEDGEKPERPERTEVAREVAERPERTEVAREMAERPAKTLFLGSPLRIAAFPTTERINTSSSIFPILG